MALTIIAMAILISAHSSAPSAIALPLNLLHNPGAGPGPLACTTESAIHHASYRNLTDIALFWKNTPEVYIPEVDHVAAKYGRMQLRDVFTEGVRNQILGMCGEREGWMVMSKAMATITYGQAWALIPDSSLEVVDEFFNEEYAILKRRGIPVMRVDQEGVQLGLLDI